MSLLILQGIRKSFGAVDVNPHSTRSSAALTTKAPGIMAAGDSRAVHFENAAATAIEKTEAAMIIVGRDVTSNRARYKASRAAFPAMNWAVTRPEQNIAVTTAEPGPSLEAIECLR